MEVMFILVPVSVVLVFLIGIGFWWSLRSGQYDDLEGPGYRVLMDDDKVRQPPDQQAGRIEPPRSEIQKTESPD